MKTKVLAALAGLALLWGCQSMMVPKDDIQIEAEADPKANFSGYRTYAWLGSAGILNDPLGLWEPPQFDADAEIEFLVDERLRKRGMTEVVSDPDMLVAYALGVDMAALEIKMDPDSNIGTLENVPSGALLITLIDPETGFVIWASTATAEIHNQGPDAAKDRLAYAIRKMFKQLPR